MTKSSERRPRDLTRRAVRAVMALLPAAATIDAADPDSDADLVVGGQPLAVVWAGEGDLRHARHALEAVAGRPHHVVVVARVLSPGARALLSDHGVGWADETGAAEIAVGPILISRTGRDVPPMARTSRWTPSAIAVAEALLCGVDGTVVAAQAVTGLSTGSCVNALRFLTDQGLLTAHTARGRDSARHIVDRDRLLDQYTSAATAAKSPLRLAVGLHFRDVVSGLVETGHRWDEAGVEWAATGVAAAAVVAPHLTALNTAEVYVAADTIVELEVAAAAANLRPIEGGRLTLRPFPTVAVRRMVEPSGDLRIVPWPRIYADLRALPVRGEEAAEHLKEVVDARRSSS